MFFVCFKNGDNHKLGDWLNNVRVYDINSFGLVDSMRIEMDCHDHLVLRTSLF